MLLGEKSHVRIREFRGPEPGSVAVLARQPGTSIGDRFSRDLLKEQEHRREVEEQVKYQKHCYLRGKWETDMDKRMQKTQVKNRLQHHYRQQEITLETRRNHLQALLAQEQRQFDAEFEEMQETPTERQARLREHARRLKEDKKEHQRQLAEEKYEQLWREQCEELRSKMSQKHCKEIAVERWEQVRMKQEIEKEQKQEDDYFVRLWHDDIRKKEERETRDLAAQKARDMEMAHVLKQQIESLKSVEVEKKKLKLEEARLLDDLAVLMKIEAKNAEEERQRKQRETRDLLESNIRSKMRRRAKEMQEELMFEMALLSELEEMAREEASQEAQRKVEQREAYKKYRLYLQRVKEEEDAKEREMERLCDLEIEKQWQRRVDQWSKERQARKALLREVLEGRRQQIDEKIRRNEELQREAQREKEFLVQQIQQNRELDQQEEEARRRKNHDFGSELMQQIDYNRDQRELERQEKLREIAAFKEAEKAFQHRVERTLQSDTTDPQLHPMRRRQLMQGQANSFGR